MPWTVDPVDRDASPGQRAILCLNDLLRQAREELDRQHYEVFINVAICRLTAEWRLALDNADDDPRGDAS
jgi:hypothetical protein